MNRTDKVLAKLQRTVPAIFVLGALLALAYAELTLPVRIGCTMMAFAAVLHVIDIYYPEED